MPHQPRRNSLAPTTLALHESLEARLLLAAAPSLPISDFSPPDTGISGIPFTVGTVSYYARNDGTTGYELWRSDPTASWA